MLVRIKTLEELKNTEGVEYKHGHYVEGNASYSFGSDMIVYCGECIEIELNSEGFYETSTSLIIEPWMCSEWDIKSIGCEPSKETVNHPNHYNTGEYEVIDVIEDWDLNFNLGNAIKYIARCNHKGNKEEDLKKAVFYINREIGKGE